MSRQAINLMKTLWALSLMAYMKDDLAAQKMLRENMNTAEGIK